MVSMVAIPVYIPNTSAQGEGNGYSLQYSCLITSWIEEPGGSVEKNLPDNVQDTGDAGSVPGLRRSPGGRNNNPIQYSYLGNPMDWSLWAKVHGVSQSWIHIVNRRTTWHELRYKLFTSIFFSSSDELKYLHSLQSPHFISLEDCSDFRDINYDVCEMLKTTQL
ncbi:uncharacterized protein LOC129659174 isoform X3 [Bubalus kerabau]|uniref:uncharacterized protein LOC129659174 isoform X3 n=1 Tax=Bubalus carabanensis TaxID=3119969 RepID=UPI00244E8168|nr:uncharacterized protein LOC129659174 isoform X3 [Bubalus carabanensis]